MENIEKPNNSFKKKAIKCVVVLLAISVVAGLLLAILNPLLTVTATEKTERALNKIYGYVPKYNIVLDVDGTDETKNKSFDYIVKDKIKGTITKIYDVLKDDGETLDSKLFYSTGSEGYKSGTISVWVKLSKVENDWKIDKVLYDTNTSQTLTSSLTNNFYSMFTKIDDDFIMDSDGLFTVENPATDSEDQKTVVAGATKSSRAVCNAVNSVLSYMREVN